MKIPVKFLRSSRFLNASPVSRATWLALFAYCYTEKNKFLIEGAEHWTDREWLQLCGVTISEACAESPLFWFNRDGDLVVYHFAKSKKNPAKN